MPPQKWPPNWYWKETWDGKELGSAGSPPTSRGLPWTMNRLLSSTDRLHLGEAERAEATQSETRRAARSMAALGIIRSQKISQLAVDKIDPYLFRYESGTARV